jgi:hypothetical protein
MRVGIAFKVENKMSLKELKEHLHASEIAIERYIARKAGITNTDMSVQNEIEVEVKDNKIRVFCKTTEEADKDLVAFNIEE